MDTLKLDFSNWGVTFSVNSCMWGTTVCDSITEERESERDFLPTSTQTYRWRAQSMPSTGLLAAPAHHPFSRRAGSLWLSKDPAEYCFDVGGGLMLAHANAKGMQALSPRPATPSSAFVWNQKVGGTNKESKSSGSGGGSLLLTAPPFSRSLSRSLCFSSSLFIFMAVSHNVRVKWHGAAAASIDGVLLCGSRVYLTWGRLHLFPLVLRSSVSDIYRLLLYVCVCVCVCVSLCNIMTRIRSATRAPELSLQPTVGFLQYLSDSSRCCRLVWH